MRGNAVVYCSNCGAVNDEGSKTCTICGATMVLRSFEGRPHKVRLTENDPSSSQREHDPPQMAYKVRILEDEEHSTKQVPNASGSSPQFSSLQTLPKKKGWERAPRIVVAIAIFIVAILLVTDLIPGLNNSSNQNMNSTDQTQIASSHNTEYNSGNYTVTYTWGYLGKAWKITETIPYTIYSNYHDQPKTYNWASFVTKDDPVVAEIATELKTDASDSGYVMAQFVLSFVQNVPYATDENSTGTTNYPRYSIETLVDGLGDCKDHSILYVSLMESTSINVGMVLLVLQKTGVAIGHMAAGIWATGATGTYFTHNGNDYYYCETTAPGYQIGQVPTQFVGYTRCCHAKAPGCTSSGLSSCRRWSRFWNIARPPNRMGS